jgi:DnaJ-class molecular chaperone
MLVMAECPTCKGSGAYAGIDCPTCDGRGKVAQRRNRVLPSTSRQHFVNGALVSNRNTKRK